MSIEVKNISYIYESNTSDTITALKNVNFFIEEGEFVGIMGHTGCGKSTLIQLISGLLIPCQGTIRIDSEDINARVYNRAELRRKVGIVFQNPEYQIFETTVEKDVAFGLKHSGLKSSEIMQRVKWALEICGFTYEEIRKKSPMSLSGGEKRRVAIAGVLAAKPKILIFDEPIAGLDPYGKKEFLEMISKLNKEGTTILMVSHDTDSICAYAKRILVLSQGELVEDGTPEEVFANVERTRELSIGVGDVRDIAQKLHEKGILSSPNVTKYETLLSELVIALKDGESL